MATLLYLDDEETIGRAVARWFERRGYVVHLARNLAQARDMLLDIEPDALFIDVWLGTESGFELMSWIEDNRPHLVERIIFVTGELVDHHNAASGRLWQSLGRPVLQKPFDFAQLEAHLQFAIGPAREASAERGTGT
ncbi:MAG: response regulator [Gemmatimonadaceae bacterium]